MKKHTVKIAHLNVGGDHPVMIQSMTNTDTAEIDKTVQQIIQLSDAGSECVRVTVNNNEAAAAIQPIKEKLLKQGYNTPIIGDFHFNGHKLLKTYPSCAEYLDKYRINPG
ncbi:MAG: flavodoxin-dependent (E)-4-hydroxy-3-methylbut-2-enyl-diphosphate synthase, partial [Gammaproteobacteria bacterium]|nr:flavodoxin-dependent (E)-4-hydroxy-3-methylbut-2-enyl-diphosphate synthase [Gammaproteobacteria bacterium]